MAKKQKSLFGDLDDFTKWKKEWKGMPEFSRTSVKPYQSILVHFVSEKDKEKFEEFVGRKITKKARSIWYPPISNIIYDKVYDDES